MFCEITDEGKSIVSIFYRSFLIFKYTDVINTYLIIYSNDKSYFKMFSTK